MESRDYKRLMEESLKESDQYYYADARQDLLLHAIVYGLAWVATELEALGVKK